MGFIKPKWLQDVAKETSRSSLKSPSSVKSKKRSEAKNNGSGSKRSFPLKKRKKSDLGSSRYYVYGFGIRCEISLQPTPTLLGVLGVPRANSEPPMLMFPLCAPRIKTDPQSQHEPCLRVGHGPISDGDRSRILAVHMWCFSFFL